MMSKSLHQHAPAWTGNMALGDLHRDATFETPVGKHTAHQRIASYKQEQQHLQMCLSFGSLASQQGAEVATISALAIGTV